MEIDQGSTVPRRQLGRYLRQLREEAQITIKLAAAELEWSAPKIWRIEGGATSMRALDVEAMCRLYRASADETQALMALARETKAKGWWHSFSDAMPPSLAFYIGLESAASRIRLYEPELVHGLLQTPAYAEEVFRARGRLADDEVHRRIALRMERQKILRRVWPSPPRIELILSEGVLRRPLQSPAATSEQFRHIVRVSSLPNVSVRVVPFAAGIHAAVMACGSFGILEFPDHGAARGAEPTTVFSDGLTGTLYLDKPDEVEAHESMWVSLARMSLNEAQSKKMITMIAKEHLP